MVPNNRQKAVQHTQTILGVISQTTLKESGQELSKNYFLCCESTSSFFTCYLLVRFKSTDDCLFLRFSGVTLFIFSMKPGYILNIANYSFSLTTDLFNRAKELFGDFRKYRVTSCHDSHASVMLADVICTESAEWSGKHKIRDWKITNNFNRKSRDIPTVVS